MRAILLAAAISAALVQFALAAPQYIKTTIETAQQALGRLGYDVGPADGKWTSKTRDALNDLRSKNDLPPADEFTGSSLALIHKLSPGEMTLAKPGIFVTDAVARRALIHEDLKIKSLQCGTNFGGVPRLAIGEFKPVPQIVTTAAAGGFVTADDDWYSPIMESLNRATNDCLSGIDRSCTAIIDFASDWAAADALGPNPKIKRKDDVETYRWIGNIMLRNMVIAYGVARQIAPQPAQREAVILDWFKRRIDLYHVLDERDGKPHDPFNLARSNHALAHMMPALAFGILVGDRSMLDDAIATWRNVLGAIRKDGSLPTEMKRGARWLHYSVMQIGQLLAVAELARGEGLDLEAELPAESPRIPDAVSYIIAAVENFDLATKYSKANFASPGKNYTIPYLLEDHFGWLGAYRARYGDDANVVKLRTATIDSRICSSAAQKENKLKFNASTCQFNKDKPLRLSTMLLMGGLAPQHMAGYPSGCLGADKGWPLEEN